MPRSAIFSKTRIELAVREQSEQHGRDDVVCFSGMATHNDLSIRLHDCGARTVAALFDIQRDVAVRSKRCAQSAI